MTDHFEHEVTASRLPSLRDTISEHGEDCYNVTDYCNRET